MMLDLSKTLFWKDYDLCVLRKNLTKEFWKNVAPEEWKSHKKKKKERKRNNSKAESKGKAKRQRKSRRNKKSEITDCVDPFHFLTKCEELSKERETKCLCSRFHRPKKRKAELNIENFMTVFPKLHPMSSRDIELSLFDKKLSCIKKSNFPTKESNIRDQHDRGKKRKQTSIETYCKKKYKIVSI